MARQLRTWLRQFNAMTSRELPIIERVHSALADNIPEQREGTLIHGDFRLDNCLVTPEGEVAAVLDWEISTLGDPLADLGILLAYWSELPMISCRLVIRRLPSRGFWVALS